LPNVVDTGYFNDTHLIGNAFRILFVGRLVPVKRADRFLRVLAKVVDALPDGKVQGVCVGSGPLQSELELLTDQLGLKQQQIQFRGEEVNLQEVYQQADVLMSTSDWEGTPNVILEAMASGLPIVATKVGGVPEILNSSCGFIVEPDREDRLASAILLLAHDLDLRSRLGHAGRAYVTKYHSLNGLQNNLMSIYQRVLADEI